ncbi:MAG: 2-oxoglutarate dehydrogenase complex dihydrolipoyllysine-residue succinyltransferase [Firmicutes bacterium]|nr:2-oxoglutarate dehydrogenase complex dihydrolipoyllysine-residue succinyltransferase [Alicyclobacillaceae bacterium]MCL6497232.1 2-oxoglutarate dehydrogenase complex dihydrolipoyllysine-residue succinyltransferase [Bacillota bacterium]
MHAITVPELGESVTEATVGRWLKAPGDVVQAGEAVVELETDKVSLEVAAPAAGRLTQIVQESGATVHPGDTLGTIEAEAVAPAPPAATPPPEPPAPSDSPPPRATPDVRRQARAHGLDLEALPTRRGRVTHDDLAQALRRSEPAPTVAPPPAPSQGERGQMGEETRLRLSRRRLTIARRLVAMTQQAALLTTFNQVDLSAVQALRHRRGEEFQQRHGVRLGLMSFFTKAAVGALKAFPALNAELDGEELVLKHYYDIGIAVATDQGLVVPVVRGADRLNFAELERAIARLAQAARENRLTLEDLQGGTFTITNGGVFGSLFSTPIPNPPQVGILGMHAIEERPVAINGQVVVRPMMYLALTYDHRVIDGQDAVQFLRRIKELIEDPERLLLEG